MCRAGVVVGASSDAKPVLHKSDVYEIRPIKICWRHAGLTGCDGGCWGSCAFCCALATDLYCIDMRCYEHAARNLDEIGRNWIFSADGKPLYFLTAAWEVSNAVHVLDMASGKEHFITDANGVLVIGKGKYANHRVEAQILQGGRLI